MKKSRALFKDYFEAVYRHGNIFSPRQYEKAYESFKMNYSEVLPESREASILDLGAGGGQFLYYLKKEGYSNYRGIDISPQQVEFCKKNVTDRAMEADAFDFLKNKHEEYDAVVANDILEHIPKDRTMELLALVRRSLKQRGVLIVRVPNMSNPFSLNSRYCDFTHETGFTQKSLYQVLWMSGFRDIVFPARGRIKVRSLRNLFRKWLLALLRKFIRFCYYVQDFTVPSHLEKNIVAVARKGQDK